MAKVGGNTEDYGNAVFKVGPNPRPDSHPGGFSQHIGLPTENTKIGFKKTFGHNSFVHI